MKDGFDRDTRLLLIRHPHTPANEGGGVRMSGWTDTPLSPRGREQALALRDRMIEERLTIEAVYTSPLERARATASLLEAIGLGELRLDPDLAEIGCGAVEGWTVDEVRRRHPDLWAQNERQDDPDFRWPGGESYREFRARCVGAVERLAAVHAGRTVAAVTHAGVVSQVLGWIGGTSPARWELHRPGNMSITWLRWRGGRAIVEAFDDRRHLGR